MLRNLILALFSYALLVPLACHSQSADPETTNQFKQYWYQGLAELTSYDLHQARYGEIHPGEAVLIFVTEDFSKSKHVKMDNPGSSPGDAVSVLKLNMVKKFFTGLYPYSIMLSSFKPIDYQNYPATLKVATSSQEWCGHTFAQLNKKGKGYQVHLNSYFESEGDKNFQIKGAVLEDEIWQIIRINPKALPLGTVELIPSTIHARLRHAEFNPQKAKATIYDHDQDPSSNTYDLQYLGYDRSLKIHFKKEFPHQILGWEETNVSGFGSSAQKLTTKATLRKSIMLDYWTRHNVQDSIFREQLEIRAN